jgi:hypothetical protein
VYDAFGRRLVAMVQVCCGCWHLRAFPRYMHERSNDKRADGCIVLKVETRYYNVTDAHSTLNSNVYCEYVVQTYSLSHHFQNSDILLFSDILYYRVRRTVFETSLLCYCGTAHLELER